jgi:hypothetical protein
MWYPNKDKDLVYKVAQKIKTEIAEYPWDEVGEECWLSEVWVVHNSCAYELCVLLGTSQKTIPIDLPTYLPSPHFIKEKGVDSIYPYWSEEGPNWAYASMYPGSELIWKAP